MPHNSFEIYWARNTALALQWKAYYGNSVIYFGVNGCVGGGDRETRGRRKKKGDTCCNSQEKTNQVGGNLI